MAPQANAQYGSSVALSARMLMQDSITPGVAVLHIDPDEIRNLREVDTMTWSYGGQSWAFRGCKLNHVRVETLVSEDQRDIQVAVLEIYDRRWRWRGEGAISGRYNHTVGASVTRQRTPRELAALCLDAMGEKRYSVSRMPLGLLVSVDWDYALPAEALASLCDAVDCRVALDTQGRVAIYPRGEGRQLPSDDAITVNPGFDSSSEDQPIPVSGALTEEVDIPLTAVGFDPRHDEWRENEQLSYRPTRGWETEPLGMWNVAESDRRYAAATVWKAYRIDAPFVVGNTKVTDIGQVLPLLDKRVRPLTSEGITSRHPQVVYGQFRHHDQVADILDSQQRDLLKFGQGIVPFDWTIDLELGIVRFACPVYRLTGTSGVYSRKPAKLWLRTAVRIRDAVTHGVVRAEYNGRSNRYLRMDLPEERYFDYEIQHKQIATTSAASVRDAQRRDVVSRLRTGSGSAIYPGLLQVDVDGAIYQVYWEILPGDEGGWATTRVSRMTEEADLSPGHCERRTLEKLAMASREGVL